MSPSGASRSISVAYMSPSGGHRSLSKAHRSLSAYPLEPSLFSMYSGSIKITYFIFNETVYMQTCVQWIEPVSI